MSGSNPTDARNSLLAAMQGLTANGPVVLVPQPDGTITVTAVERIGCAFRTPEQRYATKWMLGVNDIGYPAWREVAVDVEEDHECSAQRPLPRAQAPVPDARAMASGVVYAPDPYTEAARIRAEAAVRSTPGDTK